MNFWVSLFAALAFPTLIGCEFETLVRDPAPPSGTNHVVINEVFMLSPTNQNAFQWIEFYNPTSSEVNLRGWTLGMTTRRQTVVFDSLGLVRDYYVDEGYFDVPFLYPTNFIIPPHGFMTIVTDEDRLETYTDYGPGNGPKIELPREETIGSFIPLPPDTVRLDSIRLVLFDFNLRPTDQLILKDAFGVVVDVVRYGNYSHSGPADPFPGNRSAGFIPEYQSLARYANAYSTGNTRNDFYITGTEIPYTRPIPHWLSQAFKN